MTRRGPYAATPPAAGRDLTLGQQIRRARLAEGLTQREVAERVACAASLVTMWETEDRPVWNGYWPRLVQVLPSLRLLQVGKTRRKHTRFYIQPE